MQPLQVKGTPRDRRLSIRHRGGTEHMQHGLLVPRAHSHGTAVTSQEHGPSRPGFVQSQAVPLRRGAF